MSLDSAEYLSIVYEYFLVYINTVEGTYFLSRPRPSFFQISHAKVSFGEHCCHVSKAGIRTPK